MPDTRNRTDAQPVTLDELRDNPALCIGAGQAAQLLGLTRARLNNLVDHGAIRCHRLGGGRRIFVGQQILDFVDGAAV